MSLNDFDEQLIAQSQSSAFKLSDHCLICFSHLRWDLVFQRPQHLMTRFAQSIPVFFIEEPAFEGEEPPYLKRYNAAENLSVFVPHLPEDLPAAAGVSAQRRLVADLLRGARIRSPLLWYYTPMALELAHQIDAAVTVYDCMDELSAFQDAPPELRRLESELLRRADSPRSWSRAVRGPAVSLPRYLSDVLPFWMCSGALVTLALDVFS